MRLLHLVLGDIRFQWKYGFYLLYAILTALYLLILQLLPASARGVGGTILILSDPAAMGLFFMGAIVLLERGQRTLDALLISPVRVEEYMAAKVISLTLIGALAGLILCLPAGLNHPHLTLTGLVLGSCFFTLLGLTGAYSTNSLNGFLLAAVPLELIFLIPGVLTALGLHFPLSSLHPGVAAAGLISGRGELSAVPALLLWTAGAWPVARRAIGRALGSTGGEPL